MNEKDLVHHHRVLKQFLEISDDSSSKTKTNSSRAARAREKLLKLSGAQFRELSTDVYDELRRRIDESRGEPDFLLPKSSFHPKRNQARQKLSSLPQSRFKDLVSDISYEIERRQLHIPTQSPEQPQRGSNGNGEGVVQQQLPPYEESDSRKSIPISNHSKEFNPSHRQQHSQSSHSQQLNVNHSPQSEKHPPSSNQPLQHQRQLSQQSSNSKFQQQQPQPAIGVQSKTVIPSKANLTWSSDEEDEAGEIAAEAEEHSGFGGDKFIQEPQPEQKSREIEESWVPENEDEDVNGNGFVRQSQNSKISGNSLRKSNVSHEENLKNLRDESTKLESQIQDLRSQLEDVSKERDQSEQKYRLLQDDYQTTISENKRLSKEIEDFEEEKAQWAADKSTFVQKISDLEAHAASVHDYDSLKSSVGALRLENQSLKNSTAKDRSIIPNRTTSRDIQTPDKELPTSLKLAPPAHAVAEESKSISRNGNTKQGIERFLDQLANIEVPNKRGDQSVLELKKDVAKWQKMYEDVRAGQISNDLSQKIMSQNELKPFISPSGLIPFESVSNLIASVETLLGYLKNDTFDADSLFEKISKISILANSIAAQGDDHSLNSNENSILLREATSFALTATRYYAVYSNILPKIIVERSLGEICFSVCDLISISKLSTGKGSSNGETKSLTPSTSYISAANSGVRPLRMTTKLRETSPIRDIKSSTPIKQIPSPTNSSVPLVVDTSKKINNPVVERSIPDLSTVQKSPSPSSPVSKNIGNLASKFEKVNEDSVAKSTPPKSIGSGVAYLTNRLNNSDSSPISPSRTTPTKSKNIFDKVRQFESPNDEDSSKYSPKRLSAGRLEKSILNDHKSKEVTPSSNGSIISQESKPDTEDLNKSSGSIKRSKSLFQSIKDKLTAAEEDKTIDSVDEEGKEEPELVEKEINTAPVDPNSSIASNKSEKGFFQSIRDKITPHEEPLTEEEKEVKSVVVPKKESETPKTEPEAVPQTKVVVPGTVPTATPVAVTQTKAVVVPEAVPTAAPVSVSLPNAETSTASTRGINGSQPVQKDDDQTPFMNVSKHKVNVVNIRDPKVKEHEEEEVEDAHRPSILDRSKSTDSKSSFHSTVSTQEQETYQPREVRAAPPPPPAALAAKKPVSKNVSYSNNVQTFTPNRDETEEEDEEDDEDDEEDDEEENEARQRQEYRKSMAAATFNVDLFDIEDPDNTLTQVLLYLEHQTVQVISTIQSLLSAIKKPDSTRNDLCQKARAITEVISQMTEATNTSMNQTRNAQLKEHGSWVVRSLEDCNHRMNILCKPSGDKALQDFADKNFKQRLAGISFDIAKCTKELVKSVEEASLKEDIANLDARLSHDEDLT
ncbi:hypothetical protein CAAN3_08S02586 [[Candida] anglica]